MQRPQFKLVLNSHNLSDFQRCEQIYDYRNVKLLSGIKEHYPFKRGSGVANVLKIWYLAKQKQYPADKLVKLEQFLYSKMLESKHFYDNENPRDDAPHISQRMLCYFRKYRKMDMKVVSVEQGFSKVLYEDRNVQFIYEGKPDLILDCAPHNQDPVLIMVDHKTESRRFDIYEFNNQFLGYCWAIGANIGIINYIGLQQEDNNGEVLRRKSINFNDEQIAKWKQDTINWYYRVMYSVKNNKFLRSWNCQTKYGVCDFHKLCESSTKNEELIQIERSFKMLDAPYRSW